MTPDLLQEGRSTLHQLSEFAIADKDSYTAGQPKNRPNRQNRDELRLQSKIQRHISSAITLYDIQDRILAQPAYFPVRLNLRRRALALWMHNGLL